MYYTRQDIEQVFDLSKNYASLLPICVQSEETFRGHLLLTFLSTVIMRQIQQLGKKLNLDLEEIFEQGVRNFVSHGIIRAPDGFTYP